MLLLVANNEELRNRLIQQYGGQELGSSSVDHTFEIDLAFVFTGQQQWVEYSI